MYVTITKTIMDKLERIINIIRRLKEDAPTVSLSSGQIAGTSEAGDDPPVRRKKYMYLGKNSRKPWIRQKK
jgi:hypothetical protein